MHRNNIHMLQVPTLAPSAADCLVHLGQDSYRLARSALVSVDHWEAAHPLPWCTQAIAGLVATQWGPLPLVHYGGWDQASDPAPKLLLVLQTAKGRMAVAAHTLQDLGAGTALTAAHPDLCQTVAAHLVEWQAATPSNPARQSAAAASHPDMHFLKVRSGSRHVLLRATEVQRVGKPSQAQRLHPGQDLHWVVHMDDELLAARSLGASHPTGCHGTDEAWCLVPTKPGCQALLVQEVQGLVQAPAHRLRTLRHGDHFSTWLPGEHDAPLELLTLESPATAQAIAGALPPPAQPAPAGLPTPAAEVTAWRAPVQDALQLRVGPWNLLLAATAVQAVLGRTHTLALSAVRTAQALPVLDLRLLMDAPPGSSDTPDTAHAVAVRVTLGRRPCVLLCDSAAAAQDPGNSHAGAGWHSPPALPQTLHALVRAVRLGPDGCELLIQTPIARAAHHAVTRARLQHALVGWTSAPAPADWQSDTPTE